MSPVTPPAEPVFGPSHFVNRELSWLEFNARVLEEAEDETNPLLERAKFLSIFSSNLDEFMMVRVSGLRSQVHGISEPEDPIPDQLSARDQFELTHKRTRELVTRQYACLNERILPLLKKEKIRLLPPDQLSPEQLEFMDEYFDQTVYPVLTPMAIDPSHPPPHLRNRGLYLAAIIQQRGPRLGGPRRLLAVVQIPNVLPRMIKLPSEGADYVLLEQFVGSRLEQLFGGSAVLFWTAMRMTRDADLDIDGDHVLQDLSKAIEEGLKALRTRDAIRLEVAAGANPQLIEAIRQPLELLDHEIYEVDGPLDLTCLMALVGMEGFANLQDEPFTPRRPTGLPEGADVFKEIRRRDILVHHPYESFQCVIDFINQAATDPDVLAIKQTLYRTGSDSPIIKALINAADNGKNVTAVVELKARFDEHTNVNFARQMERAGVHVVYGFMDLKTHCKVTLVVRKEAARLRRYVHLGTGNYNATTAKIYTDLGLFTCRHKYGADATALFNLLTGYSRGHKWERLFTAPNDLLPKVLELIQRETDRAASGQPGQILVKLNALVDRNVIEALYRASQAGVQIQIQCRGSCCLRPGLPGMSENIRVTSIIDRFLEHSRIYVFGTGEEAEVFLSSADWMPRNFVRRVEVMFPVLQPSLKKHILEQILPVMFSDNVKTREMQSDGSYRRVVRPANTPALRAQIRLLAGLPMDDTPEGEVEK
jgi:polyphosphate kinase